MGKLSLNLLTFPLWWYTTGATIIWQWFLRHLRYGLSKTGLLLFARHMKEPLFGDYTRSGIIVGFFLRFVLLIYKLIIFTIRVLCLSLCALLYLLLPLIAIVMIIYQGFPA